MNERCNVHKNPEAQELPVNQGFLSSKRCSDSIWKQVLVISITICLVTILCGGFLVARAKTQQKPPECLQVACPDSWIGFQGKCFYFSVDVKNWTSSQRFCDSQDADLVQIETSQEMDFLLRYKGPSDHWIGLSREHEQPWKWTNGAEFTTWFQIKGRGKSAYLNDKGANSASSYTERKWICSKALLQTSQWPQMRQ
ncbi:C-type lectin domain family 2 member D isoform X1 [Dasypus novemcinctus]|uniref:C-type lectin domain family 2 member D isoform X1 n=1 Tax=Dasypus novemcinctus TaxID=9361 RepID=UPI00265FA6BD|nr:C-type lectin domain family 2 member D isoform X1 [Dasypus novemcinctus]